MTPTATHTDPRSVITPDAFHVSPELLGLKLASGRRRLAAIVLDLLVVGVLIVVTRSFAIILGVVAAVLLLRAGLRTRTSETARTRAMRGAVGCLGLGIGLVTVVVWLGLGSSGRRSNDDDEVPLARSSDAPGGRDATAERPAPSPNEALESRDLLAIRDEVSLYTTEEALDAYAAMLRSERSDALDVARRDALRARLVSELAADTLNALDARVRELAGDLREAEEDRDEAEVELDAVESAGSFAMLRSLLDELGFGFGWASLYFTVMLTWWNGQTIGKRLLGMRVLRLDGGPIHWWLAFERAGGYAAGFATGFVGFLQVCWDANRQMIHDRIVGTVVALDPPRKAL